MVETARVMVEKTLFKRRDFLGVMGAGAARLVALPGLFRHRSPTDKPNVILVMTDDQGWGDIGSHGNIHINTPVLDRLAESGARFDRFYVSPVCAPTRASLLTGRTYLRTGTHGGMKGHKGSVDEGGIRGPLFIRWPERIRPGTMVSKISADIDLLPTLIELTGLKIPPALKIDGMSLVPLLNGNVADWPHRMIFSRWRGRGSVRTARWRAVTRGNGWELYDMINDPNQKDNVAHRYPKVTGELGNAHESWFNNATTAGFHPIPIPIGHRQRPEVVLPGHEAFLEPARGKGISYYGRHGWANDWVSNWTDTGAYPYWEIDVVRSGDYHVTLMYTCPEQDVGSRVRVEIGNNTIEGMIGKAHDPPAVHSPDRVPRKEVYEKVWAPLTLGTMSLKKGKTRLYVKAQSKPGKAVMDLKAVHVRRIT